MESFSPPKTSCSYCGTSLKLKDVFQHPCLASMDPNFQILSMTKSGVLSIINKSEEGDDQKLITDRESSPEHNSDTEAGLRKPSNGGVTRADLDELLITHVHERRPLWDRRLPTGSRTREKKNALWAEVSKKLNGIFTAYTAEKRWIDLRDNFRKAYNKHIMRIREFRKEGGKLKDLEEVLKPTFRYYEQMGFLTKLYKFSELEDPFSLRLQTKSHFGDIDNWTDDSSFLMGEEEEYIDKSHASTSKSPRKRENSGDGAYSSTSSDEKPDDTEERQRTKALMSAVLKRRLMDFVAKPPPFLTATDAFALRLSDGLKKLPYKLRSPLEFQMFQLLQNAEAEYNRELENS